MGDIADIVGGGTPSTGNQSYWDGDIDWYAPAEIGEQSYVSKSKKTITELGLKKSSARILPVGTVLFTSRAGIGNTAILAKEATTNQGFQSIVPDQNKLDSYFIFSRTNELKRYGEVTGAGSTFVEVSGKQMSKMSIMVPELSEQQKIGSFFKQLDDTIVLHQRKLDLLKEQKKGYLQKMFPKNGEKVPELRFAGFADDWEQRKLGNLSEITDTKHATAPVVDFETPYKMIRTSAVRDGRLFPDRMDYVTYDTYEQWSERIHLKPNDVVISREAPMGEAAVIPTDNNKYFLGQRMVGIRVFDDLDPFFLLSTFLAPKFRKEIQIRNAESTTVANFGIPSIKGYEVDIPEKEEQTKIGSFFRQLDNTIALHQRKLDLLKEQKKGYLQKMFPKNGAKVPELRFAGFADDWEERKAKEMIKTHHFRSYLAEPNDVGNYEVIQQGDKPIAGYANGEPFEYFYDVTLFGDHTVSLFKPTKPFFIATDGVKIISADEFDGRYFYVTLERYKPASQGYKRHFTILKNEDIWFTTNKDEQVKIGTFFKQLDETIALHQRKLDLLKEQKKGFLQKMFI